MREPRLRRCSCSSCCLYYSYWCHSFYSYRPCCSCHSFRTQRAPLAVARGYIAGGAKRQGPSSNLLIVSKPRPSWTFQLGLILSILFSYKKPKETTEQLKKIHILLELLIALTPCYFNAHRYIEKTSNLSCFTSHFIKPMTLKNIIYDITQHLFPSKSVQKQRLSIPTCSNYEDEYSDICS